MRRLGVAAVLLALLLGLFAADPAGAQISAQPLPPPAGATGSALGRSAVPPPPAPRPPSPAPVPPAPAASRPVTKAVPTVPPPPAAKRPTQHGPPPARRPANAAVKPPAKAAAKPAAKPAVPAPAAEPAPTAAPAPAPKVDPTKGASTGLPLPRWVALRADEVNLRTGPGTQYPIDWVYHRRDYPVQVLREFEVWRLIQEQDGTKGWVHQATLTGRRGFLVAGSEQVLRAAAEDTADPVARLMPGVVGHIRKCPSGSAWCEVQTGDYRGWLKRAGIYGVSPDEAIE